MADIKFRVGTEWCDPCERTVRFRHNGLWVTLKDRDWYYHNGVWKQIVCALPYKWVVDTDESYCEDEPCIMTATYDIINETETTASATALPVDGLEPYTYLWSNGQTTQTATGLLKDTQYTILITDARGCTVNGTVTPNTDVLQGLKLEMMYFDYTTNVTTDPYYPRIGSVGSHYCNHARFEVFANDIAQGIANLNNAGGTVEPDIDEENTPPDYANYDSPSPRDRYWSTVITGSDAAEIAGPSGTVTFTLGYIGTGTPHSDACWIRITKEDGTVLASVAVDAFTSYEFNPYA